jgi:hypothetical protein
MKIKKALQYLSILISIFFLYSLHIARSSDHHNSETNIIIPGVEVGGIRIGEKYPKKLNNRNIIVLESNGVVDCIYCKDNNFIYNDTKLIGLTMNQFKTKFPNAIASQKDRKFPELISYKIEDGLFVDFTNGKVDCFCVYKIR